MLCQSCKNAEATVRITQVVHDTKSELFLCSVCAEQTGMISPLAGLPEFFGKIVAELLGESAAQAPATSGKARRRRTRRCSVCGTTLSRLETIGTLGCAHCYRTFAPELRLLLRRIHGSSQHIGSRPRALRVVAARANLPALRRELQEAIQSEHFERAAELRNLIRETEASARQTARRRRPPKAS